MLQLLKSWSHLSWTTACSSDQPVVGTCLSIGEGAEEMLAGMEQISCDERLEKLGVGVEEDKRRHD